MAPNKRKKENKGYPKGWRWKNGAIRFMVPKGLEHLWDDKTEFTLGKTDAEAYREWAKRISTDVKCDTMGQAFDKYLTKLDPAKDKANAQLKTINIQRLRKTFGDVSPERISASQVFKWREIVSEVRDGKPTYTDSMIRSAIETLSHVLSQCVLWGDIGKNPLLGVKGLKPPKGKRKRYVTDSEIDKAMSIASPMIKAYIDLKLLTGLRRGDMLHLMIPDLKDDGIHVTPRKTRESSGISKIIEWGDGGRDQSDLGRAIDNALTARPVFSPYVFCTRKGECFIKDNGSATAFNSLWSRFKVKCKAAGVEPFQEKDLRKKVATDAETLEHASQLLAHSNPNTTREHYRLKGDKVRPLKRSVSRSESDK